MVDTIYINSTEPLENMVRLNGTTWTVYAGTLYGLTPLSLVWALLNLITYVILWKKPFRKATLFKYFKLNVLNSLFLCLVLMTRFSVTVYKFDFTNSYAAMFYGNFIYAPLLSIFYLNGNLLDIFLVIERIQKVQPNEVTIRLIKLKYFWIFLFGLSVVINIPNFLITTPGYVDIILNGSILVRNYFITQTGFAITPLGKFVTYLMFFVRDFITLVIKVGLNIASIILTKKYFNKLSAHSTAKFARKDSIIASNIISISTKKTYMATVDKNLTYIAVIMSVLSSCENLFFIISYVYLIISFNQFGLTLYFFSNFMFAIKHCSNLFILYFFNNLFKEEFKKFFFH